MHTAVAAGPPASDALLYDVTFVVIDVETTGAAPREGSLIEVGAAAFRAGDLLGVFESLVRPATTVPPFVVELTGITDDMVRRAPGESAVVHRLMGFVDGAVVVGHNVSFDLGFVDGVLARMGRPALDNPVVDTLALARRLVRDESPDCSLANLARSLRLEHRPAHRALADALATADLLHRLIESATGYGVMRLGQLLELPERLAPLAVAAAGSLVPA